MVTEKTKRTHRMWCVLFVSLHHVGEVDWRAVAYHGGVPSAEGGLIACVRIVKVILDEEGEMRFIWDG